MKTVKRKAPSVNCDRLSRDLEYLFYSSSLRIPFAYKKVASTVGDSSGSSARSDGFQELFLAREVCSYD